MFSARRPFGSQTVRVPKRFRCLEVLLLHQIPSSRTEHPHDRRRLSVRGGVTSVKNIMECDVDAGVPCQRRAVMWHGQCPRHFLPEHRESCAHFVLPGGTTVLLFASNAPVTRKCCSSQAFSLRHGLRRLYPQAFVRQCGYRGVKWHEHGPGRVERMMKERRQRHRR